MMRRHDQLGRKALFDEFITDLPEILGVTQFFLKMAQSKYGFLAQFLEDEAVSLVELAMRIRHMDESRQPVVIEAELLEAAHKCRELSRVTDRIAQTQCHAPMSPERQHALSAVIEEVLLIVRPQFEEFLTAAAITAQQVPHVFALAGLGRQTGPERLEQ